MFQLVCCSGALGENRFRKPPLRGTFDENRFRKPPLRGTLYVNHKNCFTPNDYMFTLFVHIFTPDVSRRDGFENAFRKPPFRGMDLGNPFSNSPLRGMDLGNPFSNSLSCGIPWATALTPLTPAHPAPHPCPPYTLSLSLGNLPTSHLPDTRLSASRVSTSRDYASLCNAGTATAVALPSTARHCRGKANAYEANSASCLQAPRSAHGTTRTSKCFKCRAPMQQTNHTHYIRAIT